MVVQADSEIAPAALNEDIQVRGAWRHRVKCRSFNVPILLWMIPKNFARAAISVNGNHLEFADSEASEAGLVIFVQEHLDLNVRLQLCNRFDRSCDLDAEVGGILQRPKVSLLEALEAAPSPADRSLLPICPAPEPFRAFHEVDVLLR